MFLSHTLYLSRLSSFFVFILPQFFYTLSKTYFFPSFYGYYVYILTSYPSYFFPIQCIKLSYPESDTPDMSAVRQTDGRTDDQTDGRTDRKDGQIDVWMDGWMDGWIIVSYRNGVLWVYIILFK